MAIRFVLYRLKFSYSYSYFPASQQYILRIRSIIVLVKVTFKTLDVILHNNQLLIVLLVICWLGLRSGRSCSWRYLGPDFMFQPVINSSPQCHKVAVKPLIGVEIHHNAPLYSLALLIVLTFDIGRLH